MAARRDAPTMLYMWLLAVSGIREVRGIVICRLRDRIFTVRLTGPYRSAYGNAALGSLRAYFLNFTFPRGVPSAGGGRGISSSAGREV